MGITIHGHFESSKEAEKAWNKGVISPIEQTLMGMVAIGRMLNKTHLVMKNSRDEEIADINKTFSIDLANEKTKPVYTRYQDIFDADKRKFSEMINAVADAKIAEIDKTVSKTGDPSLMSLLHDLSLRTDVSDREWIAIVRRINESNDYQAMRYLAEVAPGFGRSFTVPYDADKQIRDIEQAREAFLKALPALDKPESEWTYNEMLIFGQYDKPTVMQERFTHLDSFPGVAIHKKQVSLIEQLKEAEHIADDCKDYSTANAIRRFLYDRAEYIDNKQTVAEYYRSEAEVLINKAKATMPTRNDDE